MSEKLSRRKGHSSFHAAAPSKRPMLRTKESTITHKRPHTLKVDWTRVVDESVTDRLSNWPNRTISVIVDADVPAIQIRPKVSRNAGGFSRLGGIKRISQPRPAETKTRYRKLGNLLHGLAGKDLASEVVAFPPSKAYAVKIGKRGIEKLVQSGLVRQVRSNETHAYGQT